MAGALFLKDFVAEAADVEVVANVLDQLQDQLRLVEGHHVCPRLFSEQLCRVNTTENCQMRHETYKMACNDFDLTDGEFHNKCIRGLVIIDDRSVVRE